MRVYELVNRIGNLTGKVWSEKMFKEYRCDFSGDVIDEDLNTYSFPSYTLNYGDQDPCFGSDGEEYKFGKNNGVDMYAFLSDTYSFRNDEEDNCVLMIQYFAEQGLDFASMCRASRIATAQKLIDDGKITAEQLYEDIR